MQEYKVLPIVQGAMIVALYGVFSIFNTYTGSIFDVLLAYIMVLPMAWYTYTYRMKYIISIYISSIIIIFMCGQLLFWAFSGPTLVLGIAYGMHRKSARKHLFLWLTGISFIKNSITFFIFGGILGISVYAEGKEIYEGIVYIIPLLKSILSVEVSFVILLLLIFCCEAYCVKMYGNWMFDKIAKKKR